MVKSTSTAWRAKEILNDMVKRGIDMSTSPVWITFLSKWQIQHLLDIYCISQGAESGTKVMEKPTEPTEDPPREQLG